MTMLPKASTMQPPPLAGMAPHTVLPKMPPVKASSPVADLEGPDAKKPRLMGPGDNKQADIVAQLQVAAGDIAGLPPLPSVPQVTTVGNPADLQKLLPDLPGVPLPMPSMAA